MEDQKIMIRVADAFDDCQFEDGCAELMDAKLPGFANFSETTPEPHPGYVIRKDILRAMIYAVTRKKPILLVGDSGSGKTSFATEMAARLNWPLTIISSSEETEVADLVGHRVIDEDGRMPWADGSFSKVVRQNVPFVWDEIDRVRPGVLAKFHAVFEGHPLVLDGNCGETVKPGDFFIPIATANTRGMGDLTGTFGSAQIGDQASYARFSIVVNVPYMGAKLESDSFRHIIAHDDVREAMVTFANYVRGTGLPVPFGTRTLHEWAEAMVTLKNGNQDGLKLTFTNRLEMDAHKSAVAGHFKRVFDEDLVL